MKAVDIKDEALSYLDLVSFPYGNILDCGRDHEPIEINGDGDFTAANGVIRGAGTPADPYIISGWEINAETDDGIYIRNTMAHFIIKNVCIHSGSIGLGGYYGIFLKNVKNGAIKTSSIYHNLDGIFIYESSDISIQGCSIHRNYGDGIFTRDSDDIVIEDLDVN